jgi:hypothetical protein
MKTIRSNFRRFFWPVFTLGLLVAMHVSRSSMPQREDFDIYHAAAKTAVESIPVSFNQYLGEEVPLRPTDLQLLQPNSVRNIRFTDISPQSLSRPFEKWVTLVQVRRIDDMMGHYPPVCYPAMGSVELKRTRRSWTINGQTILGTEYHFEGLEGSNRRFRIVYNFMIAPGRGFIADMEGLQAVNNEIARRFYGATQVQVLFSGIPGSEPTIEQRDAFFADVVQQAEHALMVLRTDREGLIGPPRQGTASSLLRTDSTVQLRLAQ